MKKWTLKNKKTDIDALSRTLGYSKPFCNLLVNRGFYEIDQIRSFLHPHAKALHPPQQMKGLDDAVAEIMDRIDEETKIRVIGDYDVDGVCSTYLLVEGLRACGGSVDHAIPDRVSDGYGINPDMVERCAKDGIGLIITCDNGISAHEAIAHAREKGIRTIITDHHQVEMKDGAMVLPPADHIVDPKQLDCAYPFKGLCGAGVAYKLVSHLFETVGLDVNERLDFLPVTALATVCDVVDLIDENRYLVQAGLEKMLKCDNPGLLALMEANGLGGKQPTSYNLGFIIGPCLNAAGRLTHARSALALLFEKDPQTARKLAEELVALNEERKDQTREGVAQVLEIVEERHREDRVLVIHAPNIHESIAGIVAGRVREEKYRPTVVLTDGETSAKGSGRSIDGYDMFQAFSQYRELYLGFGGHPMAVGLSLEVENIEILRRGLNETFPLSDEALIPELSLDLYLPIRFAQEQFVEEVALMEPYGKANPAPIFADKGVLFTGGRIVGKNENVLLLQIRDKKGAVYKGVMFQYDGQFDAYMDGKFGPGAMKALLGPKDVAYSMDIAYQPQINEYQNQRSIQLILKDYR